VVDVELRRLEVRADAVRAQKPPDPVLGRVLQPCRAVVARSVQQVPVQADELRKRNRRDGAPLAIWPRATSTCASASSA
jgi:hypothetical protein